METEEWKHTEEWSRYDISNEGNIRNHETGKYVKTYISDKGYERVTLTNSGKRYTKNVGLLVGQLFVDGYEEGMVISYKDGNRSNSSANNLEWKTKKDIALKTNGRKRQVKCIENNEIFISIKECSEKMSISRHSISRCVNNAAKCTRAGLHFEFID